MEIKQIIRDLIKESLNEAVEVSHSRYMRSHGKKAKGSGNWIFTTKEMGEPSKDEMVTVSGNVSDAGKEAAKKLGSNRVYVMESFDTVKEEFVTEQFNTKKGEAKEYDGKKYIGLDLFWNDEKFGEVYPHTANSQTKRAGSKIATSQKKVVRWGFRLPGIKLDVYALTNGFSSRDEASQAALKMYKKMTKTE